MRLRADFWVSAFIRRCGTEGVAAVLRRRGAPEAGAVYVKVDRLDARAALFGPAPQLDLDGEVSRRFMRLHKDEWIDPADVDARLMREIGFDADIWIVEVEDGEGRIFLDLVD